MDTKFIYEIRPIKPINLPDGRAVRLPSSASLTLEEARGLLTKGNLYRIFPDKIEAVKVTGENIEEYHRELYNVIEEKKETASEEDIVNLFSDNIEDKKEEPTNKEEVLEEVTEDAIEESADKDDEESIESDERPESEDTAESSEESDVKEETKTEVKNNADRFYDPNQNYKTQFNTKKNKNRH